MLKNKFEHKSTLVISLKLDDTNYDPAADSDLVRKQKLQNYIMSNISKNDTYCIKLFLFRCGQFKYPY